MREGLVLLATLLLSGLLSALLPEGLGGPDLFLAYALWLGPRLPYGPGLLGAFGVGLLQDLLGFGLLGLHALGLTLAFHAYAAARARLAPSSPLGQGAGFALAFLAKWGGYFLVAYWLRLDLPPFLPSAFLLEFLWTLPFVLLLKRL